MKTDETRDGMSEFELYCELITTITQIAERCVGMDNENYNRYKKRSLEECPEEIKPFFCEVFIHIDDLREKQSRKVV